MEPMSLRSLIQRCRLDTKEKVSRFHELRKGAFLKAQEVYEGRAKSYNVDHEPTDEMVYGPVSLASEMHKRTIRMCGILTPERAEDLTPDDLERLVDSCTDLMNYASWQYSILMQALAGPEGLWFTTPLPVHDEFPVSEIEIFEH